MEHYYSEKQSSPPNLSVINININNDSFRLFTAPGLFSKDKVDIATRLLITSIVIPPKSKVLDLGCGYGVVGISFLRRDSSLEIVFSDVNERALFLARKNLDSLGLKGKVKKSFLFEGLSGKFDFVLSNPPMAAGRKTCFRLIQDSYSHLKKNGCLFLVARHKKGGEMLGNKMLEVFGNMEAIAKKSGFRVYKSVKGEDNTV